MCTFRNRGTFQYQEQFKFLNTEEIKSLKANNTLPIVLGKKRLHQINTRSH